MYRAVKCYEITPRTMNPGFAHAYRARKCGVRHFARFGVDPLHHVDDPRTAGVAGITTYAYDAAGNRSSQTDARGVTATYIHDALNRLTAITYPDSALNVAYHYDETNAVTGCATSFPKGRLTRMIDASGTTAYCHDRRGNITRKRLTQGGQTYTIGYAHTRGDRLAAITYPDATKISYGRNALGQITAISQAGRPDTPIVTSATYRPFGPIAQIGFAGGASQSFTYDNNHWPTAIAGTALDLDYVHDARGNIESITDAVQTRNYAYDALSRLTQVQDSSLSLETFTYDATGNRLSKQIGATTQTYAYPPDSHRLTGIDTGTRGYDAMGNLTAQGNRTFAYGDDQRLKQFQISSQTEATYTHNGKGERARKVTNTHSVQFIYDEQGRLLAEYRAGTQFLPQLHRLYVWLDDRPVAVQPKAGSYTNTWLHVHTDHLGTPRAITLPKQGNPAIWRWSLQDSAFGEHAPEQDPDGDGDPFTFNLRYPGQYFDAESNLHYNYFRDYEPGTGRYVQSDPIGLKGGMSTYVYVESLPLGSIDPRGLIKVEGCPDCDKREIDKVKNSTREWCDWAARGSNIKDITLRHCIKQNCRNGTITCKNDCKRRKSCGKDIGVPRGYFIPEEDTNPVLCLNSVEARGGWGSTAIHEIAHSCGWRHGQGGGVPNDPGPHIPCPPVEGE